MTARPGLYVMAFLTMLAAWRIEYKLEQISDKPIRTNIEQTAKPLELKIENVTGKEEPEKFYEINGQRVYLEIDGKPIEEYFRK